MNSSCCVTCNVGDAFQVRSAANRESIAIYLVTHRAVVDAVDLPVRDAVALVDAAADEEGVVVVDQAAAVAADLLLHLDAGHVVVLRRAVVGHCSVDPLVSGDDDVAPPAPAAAAVAFRAEGGLHLAGAALLAVLCASA